MSTIDPNGHLHDDLGRYASQHRPAPGYSLEPTSIDIGEDIDFPSLEESTYEDIDLLSLEAIVDEDIATHSPDKNPLTAQGKDDMKKEDVIRIGVGAAVAAAAVTGIASWARSNDAGPPDPGPSISAPAETPTPEAPAPAPEPEPEVEEPVEAPVPTEIGASVPADQIDAARDAGASVYVSLRGDGTGLIVDPDGPLPEQVRADIEALPSHEPTSGESLGEIIVAHHEQHFAMIDSGLVAFRVLRAPTFEQDGTISDMNWMVFPAGIVPEAISGASTVAPTREGAIQKAAEQFAEWWNPDNLFG